MDRRLFLKQGAAALVAAKAGVAMAAPAAGAPQFKTANLRWQAAYDAALDVLAANVQVMPRYNRPVLIEGSVYQGIWMECGPHEALVYRKFRPDVARNGHMTFFALQSEEGEFPSTNKITEIDKASATGMGQVQMCVPLAATAWELAHATGDDELLHTAYAACSKWDEWLRRYRNTRGTGLVEGFCTYDTGMDNSPRWAGIPNRCPDGDARKSPKIPGMPRLSPDLSASIYGARVALAAMAKAMGKSAEADRWSESAESLRGLILAKLYSPEDAAFYDLDAKNQFVKIRCDILSRICGEHVVDQKLFDELWTRQIHNPKAFWAEFPLPSVALDDPLFVRPIPRNSWGGAAQALTALRAGRWFDHYGRAAEFGQIMDRWCEAIQRDMSFRQQIDPVTGEFTQEDAPKYSPCALVMMDFTWRLAGVHEEADALHWNVRPGHPAAESASFCVRTDAGREAAMRYSVKASAKGSAHGVELSLGGRLLGHVESGTVRLITDKAGAPQALLGISEEEQAVTIRLAGQRVQRVSMEPNQRIAL